MTSTATTTSDLPEATHLPVLDVEAAKEGAAESVETLFEASMTLEERLTTAHDLIGTLTRRVETARAKRDAAAWTVETCWHRRRGVSIADALGVGRTRWKTIRDRFKDSTSPPAPVPNAPTALPKLAARAVHLQAQLDHAETIRKDALARLSGQGELTTAQIARLIDRDPSRVSHLLAKTK